MWPCAYLPSPIQSLTDRITLRNKQHGQEVIWKHSNRHHSLFLSLSRSVYISPDSLSSELERFSLSTETDLSLPLSLPISGDEMDFSLSPGSRSVSLRLSSRHLSSPPHSLHRSCDGERSRSRVCDDLSEEIRKNVSELKFCSEIIHTIPLIILLP